MVSDTQSQYGTVASRRLDCCVRGIVSADVNDALGASRNVVGSDGDAPALLCPEVLIRNTPKLAAARRRGRKEQRQTPFLS